jgi:uncharacterized membrane protein YfhO
VKETLALIAALLIFVAYIPYIKDIFKGKTKPHIYSWFISALVTLIAFGLQLSDGAGWGVIPTFIAAMAGFIIFALSLNHNNRSSITKSDTFFLLTALLATGLWLIAAQALLSVVIISLIDILAFAPTFRKSWSRPDQETVSSYAVNAIRFTVATVAVQRYSFVTVIYPLSQALCDGLFTLFLLLRRRSLGRFESIIDQTNR